MRHHLAAALMAAGVAWSCGSGGPVPGPSPLDGASPSPGASPVANASPPATGAFAYAAFGSGERGGLAAYRVNLDTGALDPLQTLPLEAPSGLAADAGGRFLYAVDNGADSFPAHPTVVGYRIAGSGTLTEIGRVRTPQGWSKGARLLGVSDRYAYVMVNDSSTAYAVAIVVYRIGDDGALTQVGYSGAGVACCLQFFALDPGAHAAYMDSGGSGRVMAYRANADGTLAQGGEAPTPAVPTAGGLHPSGRWLLVGGGDRDSAYLASYAADRGALQGPVASLPTGMNARRVVLDPRGRFAFLASLDTVVSYGVDAQTGALRERPSRLAVEEAMALAADPNGRFLYVGSSFEVATFAIGDDGALRDTGQVRRPGSDLQDIAIVPVR